MQSLGLERLRRFLVSTVLDQGSYFLANCQWGGKSHQAGMKGPYPENISPVSLSREWDPISYGDYLVLLEP